MGAVGGYVYTLPLGGPVLDVVQGDDRPTLNIQAVPGEVKSTYFLRLDIEGRRGYKILALFECFLIVIVCIKKYTDFQKM